MTTVLQRTCAFCGGPLSGHGGKKTCSEECQRARRRQYYMDYYWAHWQTRGAAARERALNAYRKKISTPEGAEELAASRRAQRERNFLLQKVMRDWHVDAPRAQAWIEAGSFPP